MENPEKSLKLSRAVLWSRRKAVCRFSIIELLIKITCQIYLYAVY